MTRSKMIAKAVRDLPPFPGVAWEVMRLVKDPDSGAADLERVISRDAALTARVLKISNSALYGMRGTITTLSRAVVILGMKTLQSLVVAASSESLYRTRSLKDKLLWDHSLAAAFASRSLAKRVRYPEPEEAFIAGLLHDIGKSVLDFNFSERYQDVVQMVYNEGRTFLDAESELLDFNHAEVGGYVLRKWNFPSRFQEAVRLHHDPALAQVDPQLCAVVSLANLLCVRLEVGPERRPDAVLEESEAAKMLALGGDAMEALTAELTNSLAAEALH